jgi:tripartite-type tricarboxylate transporter receptor subunit TctC
MRRLAWFSSLVFALGLCSTVAWAQPASEFYKGKSIRVIVGTSPGDYDTWVRLVVRHLPQYIPGQPSFVVENMPGAGSLVATNHLYNRAPRDGTVLGSVSRNIPNYAFAKKPNANFDPLKFSWIGSPEMTNRGCFVRTDSGVASPADLYEREVLFGTDGAGTSLSEMPVLLKNLLGMRFRTVDGYKGSTDVVLAMQRNEVQGICQTITAFAQSAQVMLDNGTFRLLFTTERERVPGVNAPTIFEFAKDEEQRMILDFHASALETGRPWLAPPDVPADRIEVLRRGFDAAMRDPGLIEDVKKRGLAITPRTGEQIEAVLRKAAAFPPELLARLAALSKR